MVRFSHIFASALAVLGASASSSVIDLIPGNFDDIVLKSGKPALVEFFAPWCGHCKTLAPVYEELASAFASSKDKVTIAKVDADANRELGQRFGVQGFPTLKWFDGKSAEPTDYNSGRDLESLSAFITDKTGVKSKIKGKKADPTNVEMLNDQTFKKTIGSDKDVLVAFTAPWCGHCKSLAPIWEKVADDYANEPGVVIAKVDAEAPNAKRTAEEQEVRSYPTIKYFKKGSTTAVPYGGGRTEADILEYMNEKAGTHRTIGGGLDATAGTIAGLDMLVAQMTGGKDAATVAEEVRIAAKGFSDKYAEYYVKVFDKIAANTGYVDKETSRLANILKKGGLSTEKSDDIVKRSNILSRFQQKVKEAVQSVKEEL